MHVDAILAADPDFPKLDDERARGAIGVGSLIVSE
jgi:hypothetical protein